MKLGMGLAWAISAGFVIAACSSSSSDGGLTASVCTAGASVACTGGGGCSGGQVCNASGTAYGDCACGGSTNDGGSSDSGSSDSGSVDAEVDAGWTPKALSGLLFWVDGEDLGDAGTAITNWSDQSAGNNNLVVPSGEAAPSVHSSSIGGLPAAAFVAASMSGLGTAAAAADLEVGGDDYIVELVVNPAACTTPGCTLIAMYGGVGHYLAFSNGNVSGAMGNDTVSVAMTAAPHIVGLHRVSSTSAEVRIDGVATSFALTNADALTAAVTLTIGNGLTAGGMTPVNQVLDGDISEVVYAHNPSAADVTQLESYLKTKYGL